MSVPAPPLLEVRHVAKRFASNEALAGVSLRLQQGEVLAVIGENGAGKSTLMRILAGVETPTSGELRIDGRPVVFHGVLEALAAGVALIHQELNLAENLDVAANVFLGREPRKRGGWIDQEAIYRGARRCLDQIGLDVDPRVLVGSLPIGQQQLVEIAKALSTNARVLIMDEPTSSLSQRETERLFEVVRELRTRGVSIVYISHRLSEVKQLADRVTVLRDGRLAGELDRREITHDAMVRLMVGRDVSQFYHRVAHRPGATALDVVRLRTPAHPHREVSLSVAEGEIVGLAGLVGAGRSELLTTLFGVSPATGGALRCGALARPPRNPREAIAAGMALAPEDRRRTGLMLAMSACRNLAVANLRRNQRWGFVRTRQVRALCVEMTSQLRIKTAGDAGPVRYLSGGNQQKVVLGKWLATDPRVLLLDEPTRGIDVGAKEEIYAAMHELAGRGMAILFASSEMEEILGLSDRVLVMRDGQIAGELPRERLSEEAVMQLATGSLGATDVPLDRATSTLSEGER